MINAVDLIQIQKKPSTLILLIKTGVEENDENDRMTKQNCTTKNWYVKGSSEKNGRYSLFKSIFFCKQTQKDLKNCFLENETKKSLKYFLY